MTPQAICTVSVPSVPPLPRGGIIIYTVEQENSYPRSASFKSLEEAVRQWVVMGIENKLMAVTYSPGGMLDTGEVWEVEHWTTFDRHSGKWSEWSNIEDDSVVPLGTEEYDAAPITTLLTATN